MTIDIRVPDAAYRGRFAPSPTGPLHFGSLVAAVGSYAEARSRHGKWLVRIDDLDPSREIPGAANNILYTLEKFGFEWDEAILYQSQRNRAYESALSMLRKQKVVYRCTCSRTKIFNSGIMGIDSFIYPGTCRKFPTGKEKYATGNGRPAAWRVKTNNKAIEFNDSLQGISRQQLDIDIGDFVLKRADGVYAYHLATVVDDYEQGITQVVRGRDLLRSTPRQIYLQQLLGYISPLYAHLPVVTDSRGEKLAKQTHAAPILASDPITQLVNAIRFLGQNPPAELDGSNVVSFWKWAISNWSHERVGM